MASIRIRAGFAARCEPDRLIYAITTGVTAPAAWFFSAAAYSDGSYGVEPGIYSSFPLTTDGQGKYSIVQGLPMSDWAKGLLQASVAELKSEKAVIADLLKG